MSASETNTSKQFVDLLDEDKPIAGQKFVCMSFVSPDRIVKQKEMFFFEQFLKHFDFAKSLEKFQQFCSFMSFKYDIPMDTVQGDLQEFIKSEKDNLIATSVEDEYRTFLDHKETQLEKEFSEMHQFQTNVRGVKIRGSFPTQEEAELRCKMLREQDPNHDIYVGPVGTWMPWEPEAYKTGRVEYLQDDLNRLMQEKTENEARAKDDFDARVREAKEKAIKDNIEKAKESGNKLTQNIDEQGNLVNIASGTGPLQTNEVVSTADIRKELFEGDVRDDDGTGRPGQ